MQNIFWSIFIERARCNALQIVCLIQTIKKIISLPIQHQIEKREFGCGAVIMPAFRHSSTNDGQSTSGCPELNTSCVNKNGLSGENKPKLLPTYKTVSKLLHSDESHRGECLFVYKRMSVKMETLTF